MTRPTIDLCDHGLPSRACEECREPGEVLPPWPDEARNRRLTVEYLVYWRKTADAAIARMEALEKWAVHDSSCGLWVYKHEMEPYLRSDRECTCGLSALLSACGRTGGSDE